MENTLEEKFISELRRANDRYDLWKFYNLFSILKLGNSNFLNDIVELYKQYPDNWFEYYHKSFRQGDVFSSEICKVSPIITPDENKERIQLWKELCKMRREDNMYQTNTKYINKNQRHKELVRKFNSYSIDESITGHLDSLMHIAINENDHIYDFVNKFLNENIKS